MNCFSREAEGTLNVELGNIERRSVTHVLNLYPYQLTFGRSMFDVSFALLSASSQGESLPACTGAYLWSFPESDDELYFWST